MQSVVETKKKKIVYFSNKGLDMEIQLKAGERLIFNRDDQVSMIVHKGQGEFKVGKRRRIRIRERDIIHCNELGKKILVAITSMMLFIHVEAMIM